MKTLPVIYGSGTTDRSLDRRAQSALFTLSFGLHVVHNRGAGSTLTFGGLAGSAWMKETLNYVNHHRGMLKRKISLIVLAFVCAPLALSQDAGLPPLGKDAIEHLGQVVSKYDKFTDKSKIELALKVDGNYLEGTFLIALCVFSGQIAPANAKVVLG